MPAPEELARQQIDALLIQCGSNLGRQAIAEWREATSTAVRSPQGQRRLADQFQQFVTPDGRKFTELYNVQHLTSNKLDGVCRVTICTIQCLYAMLRSLFSWLNKRSRRTGSREETGRASCAFNEVCGSRPLACLFL